MWGLKSSSHRYDEETDDESPYAVSVEEEPAITRLANANGESRSAPAPIPPLPPLPPPPSPPRDSSESEEDSESDLEADQILQRLNNKRKRKAGRKSTWSLIDLSELTDVVCSSERYKRNIIFQNTKNKRNSSVYADVIDELTKRAAERGEVWSKNIDQTRNKFKKMIALCKKKALARISESGIANEIMANGEWFKMLFPLVQSRASADPDNAREPSYEATATEADEQQPTSSTTGAPSTSSSETFVPTKKKSRKMKKDELLADAIKAFQNESGGTKDMVEFLEKEGKETREHERKMQEMHQ
jgi:hypothetical protein